VAVLAALAALGCKLLFLLKIEDRQVVCMVAALVGGLEIKLRGKTAKAANGML
jgi:hypothetical protein